MAKKMRVNGVIVSNDVKWIYEWFEIDATCPKDLTDVLDSLEGEAVEVEINSGGGEVWAGSEMYYALKNYKGHVTTIVSSIAGSAASVIAMAGDKVVIAPTAQIMIHNVASGRYGDYRDMQQESDILKNYNKSIANAYILKTGMNQDALLDLMNKETWLNAQQAKELGFVDEILFDEESRLVASVGSVFSLPPEVINKIRNLISRPSNGGEDKSLYQARLNFLKLKGEFPND